MGIAFESPLKDNISIVQSKSQMLLNPKKIPLRLSGERLVIVKDSEAFMTVKGQAETVKVVV